MAPRGPIAGTADEIMEPMVHYGMLGATIDEEVSTDLGYADDRCFVTVVDGVLLLAMKVMGTEAKGFSAGDIRPNLVCQGIMVGCL